MAEQDDLSFASIAAVGAQIRDLQLSPVALAEHCLRRIDALNPTLNAFITVTADLARVQARNAENEIRAGRWRGPLHGVPVAVKDFYDTAGIRTTVAFEHFRNRIPAEDADLVVRLRAAGAVLLAPRQRIQMKPKRAKLAIEQGWTRPQDVDPRPRRSTSHGARAAWRAPARH